MVNNSILELENHEQYAVIDKIPAEDGNYIYLSNIKDTNDFCVRKEIKKEEEFFLVGLKDEEEVDNALTLFQKKHTA
ncbi:MAG: hypothetical protein E7168_01665 [Firmicutes bacterium]|nr:hypothetical protein [Bacillota bacterium]